MPDYEREADQWRRDLRSAVDAGQAALRDRTVHVKHAQRLTLLVKRAEKLFGDVLSEPFGACIKAASLVDAAWQDETVALSRADAVKVGGIAAQSFEAGSHYWACRLAIDELESKKP